MTREICSKKLNASDFIIFAIHSEPFVPEEVNLCNNIMEPLPHLIFKVNKVVLFYMSFILPPMSKMLICSTTQLFCFQVSKEHFPSSIVLLLVRFKKTSDIFLRHSIERSSLFLERLFNKVCVMCYGLETLVQWVSGQL